MVQNNPIQWEALHCSGSSSLAPHLNLLRLSFQANGCWKHVMIFQSTNQLQEFHILMTSHVCFWLTVNNQRAFENIPSHAERLRLPRNSQNTSQKWSRFKWWSRNSKYVAVEAISKWSYFQVDLLRVAHWLKSKWKNSRPMFHELSLGLQQHTLISLEYRRLKPRLWLQCISKG